MLVKYMKIISGIAVIGTLAGCTTATIDVPRANNYPLSSQQKVRAVHHWDVLATDVAARIAEKMQGRISPDQSIYVVPASDAAFDKSFRNLLITRLVDKGVAVAVRPGALRVNIETQVIKHNSGTGNSIQYPLTTLAAGIAVARDLTFKHSATAYSLIGLGAAAAIDSARLAINGTASGGPTRTEVLVSTSLENSSQYLARTSDLYYIEREDSTLYAIDAMKSWEVVGK